MTKSGGLNIVELFIQGGWVMYPIVLLSVVAVTIVFERMLIIMMQGARLKPEKFSAMFEATLKKNNGDKLKTVEELIPFLQKKGGVTADICSEAMDKFRSGIAKNFTTVELKQWMMDGAAARANTSSHEMEKHLGALAVISNVATLVGLFGTVIGMIESFTAMSRSAGGVKADEMAGGIAVALVATAGGLCVAIPSLILYNWIRSFIEGFIVRVEECVSGIMDTLLS